MTQAYYIYYMENWSTINILVQIAVACMMCFDLYRCRGRAHGDGLMDRLGFEFGSCSPWPLAVAGGRRCNENACMHGPGRWIGAAVAVADEPTNQRSIIYHLSINHVLCYRLVSCWGHPCIISLSPPLSCHVYHISLWQKLVLVVLATTCMVAWFDVGVWMDSPELDGSIRPPHAACVLMNLNDWLGTQQVQRQQKLCSATRTPIDDRPVQSSPSVVCRDKSPQKWTSAFLSGTQPAQL